MKRKVIFAASCCLLMIVCSECFLPSAISAEAAPDFYAGVSLAYGDVCDAKALIDQVCSYTNFFVVGTTQITHNITKINETCQYLHDRGMYFTLFLDRSPSVQLLDMIRTKWVDRFLGFYAYDEVGGRQLDQVYGWTTVSQASSYADAENQFVNTTMSYLRSNVGRFRFTRNYANATEFPLFTSDYALYWFDYKAGYDVVWAQLGWNYSRQLNIALCRGAATMQNKEWGTIVTWTYTVPPYLLSGSEIYNDMVQAYANGAKYILIFDSNENYTQGILQSEHFDAIRQFWQYTQNCPRKNQPAAERVAFVLPSSFAYGFRGPDDKIWGLWPANSLSRNISTAVGSLLETYGDRLDIIYEDDLQPANMNGYGRIVHWNDSSIIHSQHGVDPSQCSLPHFVTLAAAAVCIIVPLILLVLIFRKRKKQIR